MAERTRFELDYVNPRAEVPRPGSILLLGRHPNPLGPPDGESRIPRGGSWLDTTDDVRSANRGENSPDYVRHKVGFRCAARR